MRQGILVAVLAGMPFVPTATPQTPVDLGPQENAPQSSDLGEARVLHLGNEGFLIESGGDKILIDAIQGPGITGYVTMPTTRRQTLLKALPPFDGVDLVLATHRHDDHFNPWSVGRFLRASPETLFVSTEQSVERLAREFPEYEQVKARVRGFDPSEGQPVRLEHSGIEVTILNLHHGRGTDVDNLGFVFEVGGLRFLHVGDTAATPEEFARYDLVGMSIHVAMLPFWIPAGERWPQYEKAIGARHVVVMHIPAPDAPARYFGHGKATQASYLEWLRGRRPGMKLFWEPFQTERFTVGESPRD